MYTHVVHGYIKTTALFDIRHRQFIQHTTYCGYNVKLHIHTFYMYMYYMYYIHIHVLHVLCIIIGYETGEGR